MATASYQHKFKEAGHLLNIGFNYTFTEKMKIFLRQLFANSTGTGFALNYCLTNKFMILILTT
jgi:hypothetical protein